jgi:hypothetical protein
MNRFGTWVGGAVLACGLVAGSRGEEPDPSLSGGTAESRFTVEAGWTMVDGNAGFRLGYSGANISRLVFPIEGHLWEARASAWLAGEDRWSLRARGRYSGAIAVEGSSTDTDWDWYGELVHYSRSDTEADVEIWDADLLLLAWPAIGDQASALGRWGVGLFVGYGVQRFDFTVKGLEGLYEYGEVEVYEEGDVATYDLKGRGPRFGAHVRCEPSDRLALVGEVGLMPIRMRGDAYWILRNFPFTQEATGRGTLGRIWCQYRFSRSLSAFVEAYRTELIADRDGRDSGLADGEIRFQDMPIVDEITAEHWGATLGVTLTL